jgi:hypothetical protein
MIEPHLAIPHSVWIRIEAKFIPEPNSGCWLWLGALDDHGYARLKVASYQPPVKVHRYIWEQCNCIKLPTETHACHSCDNPPCINPEHVFPGDALLNRQDSMRKGRHNFGARNGGARLSATRALEIMTSQDSDEAAAERFSVSVGHVYAIRRGIKWRLLYEKTFSAKR